MGDLICEHCLDDPEPREISINELRNMGPDEWEQLLDKIGATHMCEDCNCNDKGFEDAPKAEDVYQGEPSTQPETRKEALQPKPQGGAFNDVEVYYTNATEDDVLEAVRNVIRTQGVFQTVISQSVVEKQTGEFVYTGYVRGKRL